MTWYYSISLFEMKIFYLLLFINIFHGYSLDVDKQFYASQVEKVREFFFFKLRQNRSSESKDRKAEKKPDAEKTVQTHNVVPGGNTHSHPFSIQPCSWE